MVTQRQTDGVVDLSIETGRVQEHSAQLLFEIVVM